MTNLERFLKPSSWVYRRQNLTTWIRIRRIIEAGHQQFSFVTARRYFRFAVKECKWFEGLSPEGKQKYANTYGVCHREMLDWIKILHSRMKASRALDVNKRMDLRTDAILAEERIEKKVAALRKVSTAQWGPRTRTR